MQTEKKQQSAKEDKIDKAVKETFPASDTPRFGDATGTEPQNKPTDRQAPVIHKEDIEAAQRGEGHKQK